MEQIKECVVYKITNIVNSRIYIGISNNYLRRMGEHKRYPNKKIQKDIDEFGFTFEGSFNKEIIFQGAREKCLNKEIELIAKEKPYYNSSLGGEGGNGLFGEDIWNSKLTAQEVMEIRYLYKYVDDYTQQYIGDLYNIGREGIRDIVLGKIWKKANGPISKALDGLGENNPMSILTEKDVEAIRIKARDTDDLLVDIAKDYPQINSSNLSRIITGDRWEKSKGPIEGIDYVKERKTGPKSGVSKNLSKSQILEIRNRGRDTKDSYIEIAKDYPVGSGVISKIINDAGYGDYAGPIRNIDYIYELTGNKKLTEKQILSIRERAKNTYDTYTDIGNDYNVTYVTVRNVVRKVNYKDIGGPIEGVDYIIAKDRKILEIREDCFRTKDTYVMLGKKYKTKADTISLIARGKSRSEVGGPILGPNGDYQKRGEGAL